MTIVNGAGIKAYYVQNLPENRDLLRYARENRRAGNMAEIAFWKQVHKKMFHGHSGQPRRRCACRFQIKKHHLSSDCPLTLTLTLTLNLTLTLTLNLKP